MHIELIFPSGKKKRYKNSVLVGEVMTDKEFNCEKNSIVAALLNNEVVSLSYCIPVNGLIKPVYLNSPEGTTLYRRTLCFLLAIASKRLFPERRLIIGHSLGEGYYYHFDALDHVSDGEIRELDKQMKRLVRENHPIQHKVISYLEAVDYFKKDKQPNTALFLKYQNRTKVPVYQCLDVIDLAHGPLLSHTGCLKIFELKNYRPGFLLRFPTAGGENKIPPLEKNPVLFSVYKEYKSWGKVLNMSCVGLLNQLIIEGNIKEFIQVSEALHDKKIANIADRISERRDVLRLILIAGPSSSGKTTFSKKLAIQLRVIGRNPVTVSIDDYFFPRENTPLDENGEPDFETLEAIDISLLNSHLIKLFNGEEILIPSYDFITGRRKEKGNALMLPQRSIVILEGIHGLNERLTPQIRKDQKFKIYVSALTQLNLDDHNRISTTDNRLIRRIVRDRQFRGHSALDTMGMWPSVSRGEDKFIFPFQNGADEAFNSALDYELSVLKLYAEPLLRTIKPDVKEYGEARRLLSFIENFLPIKPTLVPSQSILREFIGESEFKY